MCVCVCVAAIHVHVQCTVPAPSPLVVGGVWADSSNIRVLRGREDVLEGVASSDGSEWASLSGVRGHHIHHTLVTHHTNRVSS